jgi:predicted Zn-dependent peptidase
MEHICIINKGLSMQDEKRYAASLLSSIIGDSTGSRYFWQLVDPAIVEDASMQFEAMDGTGAIFSYVSCSPEKAQKAIEIIDNIFIEVTNMGVSENELIMAKNKLLSAITIKNELPMGRLIELGFNWIYLNKYVDINDTVNKIKSVTLDEINYLCKELKLQNNTRLSIGPQNYPCY